MLLKRKGFKHVALTKLYVLRWHKEQNILISGFSRGVNETFALPGCVRSVDWYLFTDVSGQPIRPIF